MRPMRPPRQTMPAPQASASKQDLPWQLLVYFPLKLAFAIGGGVVGGLAYGFSGGSEQTAKNIWIPSMYGTYIITPEHLKGDKPIRFLGVPAESQRDAVEYTPQEPAPLPLEPIR